MNLSELLNVTSGVVINNMKSDKTFDKISINSKEVQKNSLFIALKGKNHDSHDYLEEVIKKRPAFILVEKDIYIKTKIPIIKVDSCLDALIKIGSYYRNNFHGKVICITGSAGKTMTKELIYNILKTKYNVLKSEGNHNNHIGLPLTLNLLNNHYDVLVLEMGMNHLKEIDKLSKMCKPSDAVITNIGTAHIGNLGSKKNIFKAKMEIINGMNNGNLFVNGYDDYLKKIKKINNINIIKVGLDKKLFIKEIKEDLYRTCFKVTYNDKDYDFTLNIPGAHLIQNCMLAIKVGLSYDISIDEMVNIINNYKPLNNRLNVYNYGDNILIDDSYNSNFESLSSILNYLKNQDKNKILILGDILELGKYSKPIHKKIGKIIKKDKFKQILLVGKEMLEVHKINHHSLYFNSNNELINYLKQVKIDNSIILVKGSNSTHLDKIVEFLKNKLEEKK